MKTVVIPVGVLGTVKKVMVENIRESSGMHTLGDAFSVILGAKSRAFRTEFYQVTFVSIFPVI